jgi:Uma2 family endonuclease
VGFFVPVPVWYGVRGCEEDHGMTFDTFADVLAAVGDVPPERVRVRPAPGTATEADVLEAEEKYGKLCELIDGTLVEKTVGFREAHLASQINRHLGNHVVPADLGYVAGADGTVKLFPGMVRIPDVAFYLKDKFPGGQLPDEPIPELYPDLAVEVLSRGNTKREMQRKLKDYFFAGTKLVWYVDPETRTVEVYTAPDQMTRLTEIDTLTGDLVLPGFALSVAAVFARGGATPPSAQP